MIDTFYFFKVDKLKTYSPCGCMYRLSMHVLYKPFDIGKHMKSKYTIPLSYGKKTTCFAIQNTDFTL